MIPIQDRMPDSIEYIGSKKLLTGFISNTIHHAIGSTPKVIADVFSGTGVVSATFKAQGYKVHANDHLTFCSIMSASILLNNRAPSFKNLKLSIFNKSTPRYLQIIKYLNNIAPIKNGFIHRNYSPASSDYSSVERKYFTEENAAKIDAIRLKISEWKNDLSEAENALLLSNLILAVSDVSNVAGTYGCYLKEWKARSLKPIMLKPSIFIQGAKNSHIVTSTNAEVALSQYRSPIVYADPPYTKRQYAAYYHLLETIILDDSPDLIGTTGLRDWSIKSSDFCYKRKAPEALKRLVTSAECRHFFMSYNSDGQIPHDRIMEILSKFGLVRFNELKLKRYKSSNQKHKGPVVVERLYHLATQ